MVETPVAIALAVLPATVATALLEDVHVDSGVQSDVDRLVPLVNVPVAVNGSDAPTSSVGPFGATVSDCSISTATVALDDWVGSETRVALTCGCTGLGTEAGAVYRPLVSTVPGPVTVQVTLVRAELFTAALN